MALLDISLVTQTLINLIRFSFKASDLWNTEGNCSSPVVSPCPPYKNDNESVGIYLYHFDEESYLKNMPPKEINYINTHDVPQALSLYFQLTAHSNLQTDQATLIEQKMMSIAVKAFHDYPVINDNTKIIDLKGNTNKVFPLELQNCNNSIRIFLQNTGPHEAISYWTRRNEPVRLAVYFQVNVLLGK